jgi:hypothetical protein
MISVPKELISESTQSKTPDIGSDDTNLWRSLLFGNRVLRHQQKEIRADTVSRRNKDMQSSGEV